MAATIIPALGRDFVEYPLFNFAARLALRGDEFAEEAA